MYEIIVHDTEYINPAKTWLTTCYKRTENEAIEVAKSYKETKISGIRKISILHIENSKVTFICNL